MNRREVLGTLAAVSVAGFASQARSEHEHEHHANDASAPTPTVKSYEAVRAAAAGCVSKGQVCLAHCIRLLSQGETSMDKCAVAVNQMLALCGALQNLAAQGSQLTPALAKVALDGCTQCAEACKPHIEHHAECNACYESCQECIKQCKELG